MASLVSTLFGGGTPQEPVIIQSSNPGASPTPPSDNSAAVQEAQRKERALAANALSGRNTILTDFALASVEPSTLKKSLGGA